MKLPDKFVQRARAITAEKIANEQLKRGVPQDEVKVDDEKVGMWMTYYNAEQISMQVAREFGEAHDSVIVDMLEVYLMNIRENYVKGIK